MPFLFWLAILLALIGTSTAVTWRVLGTKLKVLEAARDKANEKRSQEPEETYRYRDPFNVSPLENKQAAVNIAKYATAGMLALALLLTLFSSLAVVGTRQVGVVTTFGRPSGDTLSNGLHMKAPWQKVTEVDATIRTDNYVGGGGVTCIDIRIGNGSIACIDTTIRWRIIEDAADVLYQDYRDKDDDINNAVRDSLVKRELNSSLNEVYGTYDPLAAVKGGENVTVDSLSKDVESAMRDRVEDLSVDGAQVEILSVTTPLIRLDKNTQEKIDLYQAEIANTRIAEQKKQTATQEALANAEISDSISENPMVLAYKCLNIMDTLAKTGDVPPGMYCFPGGNAPVVVPSSVK